MTSTTPCWGQLLQHFPMCCCCLVLFPVVAIPALVEGKARTAVKGTEWANTSISDMKGSVRGNDGADAWRLCPDHQRLKGNSRYRKYYSVGLQPKRYDLSNPRYIA